MARRALIKRKKKVAPAISRKSKASMLMEESKVGRETVDWSSVPADQVRARVTETLRHYGYFYDYKDAVKWAAEYVKKYRKGDLKAFREAEDWRTSTTLGGMCRMIMNGAPLSEDRVQWVNDGIDKVVARGKERVKEKKDDAAGGAQTKTIADLIKEKISDKIAEVDEVLDTFGRKEDLTKEFSLYKNLQAEDASAQMARALVTYYAPIRDEINELVTKKTKDLEEAYSWLGPRKRKEYLKFLESLVADAEAYINSKKAVRAPRIKKKQSTGQQVAKLKYMKSSNEYKVTSVDPTRIPGATVVYLFNTKYRRLAKLVTSSSSGFEVSGTTIKNVDLEASSEKTLRKPEEQLPELMKLTQAKANKFFDEIKTKGAGCNGRVNEMTLIVKVY